MSFLTQIASGFASGILGSFFTDFIKVYLSKSHLDISKVIVEQDNHFSFKIQNNSRRTLSNIRIYITYSTRTKGSPTITLDSDIPFLMGKHEYGVKNNYDLYEKVLLLPEVVLEKKDSPRQPHSNELTTNKTLKENVKQFLESTNDDNGHLLITIQYDDIKYRLFNRIKRRRYKDSRCFNMESRFNAGQMETTPDRTAQYTTR